MVTSRRTIIDLSAATGLILLGLAAYATAWKAPFLFDDFGSIVEHRDIGRLWPPSYALSGPAMETTAGRPLAALSFNVQYALGARRPAAYRAVNVAIHLAAGLALWGVMRRVFARAWGPQTPELPSWTAAAMWVVHPMQTESVTYIVQRVESMMGLFYLLTIYAGMRSVEEPGRRRWRWLCAGCCAAGMGCKEVMATAPVMVALVDRAIYFNSWSQAARRRWPLYAALAGTWLILAGLLAGAPRKTSAGLGLTIGMGEYLATQAWAILRYLRLAIWPDELVFDYGRWTARSAAEIAPGAAAVALILAGTIACWTRRSRSALLTALAGAWFVLILSPSSSIVPIASQTVAEHRMYLSLAAVTGAGAAALGLGRLRGAPSAALSAVAIAALTAATIQRNHDYRTAEAIWADTAAKRPGNSRASTALGLIAAREGRLEDAERWFITSLADPRDFEAHANYALVLHQTSRWPDAERHYRAALQLLPDYAEAHRHYGLLLLETGRLPESEHHLRRATELDDRDALALNNLATVMMAGGRHADAEPLLRRATAANPNDARAWINLGTAVSGQGRTAQAIDCFRRGLALDATLGSGWSNLGFALEKVGDRAQAAQAYAQALRIEPDNADAKAGLERLK
jgi:Flp pilus assembly protein TadD